VFTDFQVLLNKDKIPVSIKHQADSNITRSDILQNFDSLKFIASSLQYLNMYKKCETPQSVLHMYILYYSSQ